MPSSPEYRFRRNVLRVTLAGVLMLFYVIAADHFMPLTPEARVLYPVTRIAPEVSGRVLEVMTSNDQGVRAGEELFKIDPLAYAQNVAAAHLAMEQAERDNSQLDADISEAEANVVRTRASADDARTHAARLRELLDRRAMSRDQVETALANSDIAVAEWHANQARLNALKVERGVPGQGNLRLRQARNVLDIARRDLARAHVTAPADGTISNLQVNAGDYATAGTPMLAMVGSRPWVAADFREKALSGVQPGDRAWVSFDALPGRIFSGEVDAIEAGIGQGQLDADGQLVTTTETDRWLRRAERLRVNIRLNDVPTGNLASGSRATVQLMPAKSALARWLANLQIRLVAFAHYVY